MEDKVMALMLDEELDENVTTIKVIGVGGGGGNAVNRMVSDGLQGVEFIAMNTDQQALAKNHASVKVQLGSKLTKGRGAGADPEIGQRAAEESKDEIANALKGSQMVFITAGMGGGTGTGAAPIIAQLAHDKGILTVGVVTKPFKFEGANRMRQAEGGIANLSDKVDSLIIIPNDRLKFVTDQKITFANAFGIADDFQMFNDVAVRKARQMFLTLAPNAQIEPDGQSVDDRNADTVQTAGNLIGIVVELAAGVKFGHDDLGGGNALFLVHADRNAAAVVANGGRTVGIEDNLSFVAITGQSFVNGVVQHFVNHVVEAGNADR